MVVTAFTRRVLAFRREQRDLAKAGYEYVEPWKLMRGDQVRMQIADLRLSVDGKRIWYRVEGSRL